MTLKKTGLDGDYISDVSDKLLKILYSKPGTTWMFGQLRHECMKRYDTTPMITETHEALCVLADRGLIDMTDVNQIYYLD